MQRLIECVPNFSEGRDQALIKQITQVVERVEGVRLLDVDSGKATNRTVVTFVGEPEPVLEAAFQITRKACELLDMRLQKGEHPRFGAMDVVPLVPVAGITMDETAELARRLAKRLGDELGLTIYCYESAAFIEARRNLSYLRTGEYEGLKDKLAKPEWKPDFGPAVFSPRSGATAVGARDFLIAYNVNLNTTSTRRANAIAYDVREKGRVKTVDGEPNGKPMLDANGEKIWEPGTLKAVKAIGWFIEEYGICQISMNLTNISITPLHVAFDEVCAKAAQRGIRVTGSEMVGLVPLRAMLDAGRYFLRKQHRSIGVSDCELIKIAIKSMGLDELHPFKPEEKIIEYVLADHGKKHLADWTLRHFVEETAAESPAPGGGSVSALVGALGAALAGMVANLSSHKRGWDDRWEEFSGWAEKAKCYWAELLHLVDEDTDAFSAIMAAFGLPRTTPEEIAARRTVIQAATKRAIEIPLLVMETAAQSMAVMRAMAEIGMEAGISDAGVAALCARTAVIGAHLNVRINAKTLDDKAAAAEFLKRAADLETQARAAEDQIVALVIQKIGAPK